MTDIRVGMQVECIRDHDEWTGSERMKLGVFFPEKGKVYTVREIFVGPFEYSDRVYVRLVEIRNADRPTDRAGPFEPAFNAGAFRPLVRGETRSHETLLAPAPKGLVDA